MGRQETEHNCQHCGGRGWNFILPSGMNAFEMGVDKIARVAKREDCRACYGIGRRSLDTKGEGG